MGISNKNPYKILKVDAKSSLKEIKLAYRNLVKKSHPDAGGNKEDIIEINAAWEILKDEHKRFEFDSKQQIYTTQISETHSQNNTVQSDDFLHGSALEVEVIDWIQKVYLPVDRLLGNIINPFEDKLRELSADPYDDILMESFTLYIDHSNKTIAKINNIYTSKPSPKVLDYFSLILYQCFSQLQDGINELERYTMGYVDDYLHDGKEMIIEADKSRKRLHLEKKQLSFF